MGAWLAGGLCFLLFYGRVFTPVLVAASACLLSAGLALGRRRGEPHGAPQLDRLAQASRLGHWNAGLKLCFCLGCALLCVGVDAIPLSLTVAVLAGSAAVLWGGVPLRRYLSLLAVPALFILLGALTLLLEVSPRPLGLLDWRVGGRWLCVTPSGQLRALALLARSLGAICCLYLLSLTTPVHKIIAALGRAKVPGVIIELMYLICRYLFVLWETLARMTTGARARLGDRNAAALLRTALLCSRGLFLISWRQAADSFAAMESRCYDGTLRFLEEEAPLRAPHLAGAGGCFALLAGWGLLLARGGGL